MFFKIYLHIFRRKKIESMMPCSFNGNLLDTMWNSFSEFKDMVPRICCFFSVMSCISTLLFWYINVSCKTFSFIIFMSALVSNKNPLGFWVRWREYRQHFGSLLRLCKFEFQQINWICATRRLALALCTLRLALVV